MYRMIGTVEKFVQHFLFFFFCVAHILIKAQNFFPAIILYKASMYLWALKKLNRNAGNLKKVFLKKGFYARLGMKSYQKRRRFG